jgi:hypothetical protein
MLRRLQTSAISKASIPSWAKDVAEKGAMQGKMPTKAYLTTCLLVRTLKAFFVRPL